MKREKQIDIAATHYDYGYYEGSKISAYCCFRDGAEWADAHPKSPWISVDDDLPCNHKELTHSHYTDRVLVLSENGHSCISFMSKIEGNWEWGTFIVILYWMPIPKLPKK